MRRLFLILSFLFLTTAHTTHKVQVLSWAPRIFLIEHFLTPAECDYMIEKSKPELTRSTVVSVNSSSTVDNDRTSQGMFFATRPEDPILKGVELRIAELTQLPWENGEAIQVLSYGVGAEYKPHYDYFDPSTRAGAQCYHRGGQRIATIIMYLADTEQGGETIFPKANISIRPVKGNAVLFYNCTPDGVEDTLSLHGGAPVLKGHKWIATKWIRKGEFH